MAWTRSVPTTVDAHCPLCGVCILSIGRGGRVENGALHPVPLFTGGIGEGVMLCEQCGVLAELSPDITRN